MIRFYLLITLSLSIGCATSQGNDPYYVKVPKADKKIELSNIEEAFKHSSLIGDHFGSKFTLYAGPKGTYYIVITGRKIDLSMYDANLEVDIDGESPETISLAYEDSSVLSGFGSVRDNVSYKFKLSLIPIDKTIGKTITFDFKAKLLGY